MLIFDWGCSHSQPYLSGGAKWKNRTDFSSFSCFFLIFSLSSLIFGKMFAVKGGGHYSPPCHWVQYPLNSIWPKSGLTEFWKKKTLFNLNEWILNLFNFWIFFFLNSSICLVGVQNRWQPAAKSVETGFLSYKIQKKSTEKIYKIWDLYMAKGCQVRNN